MIRKDKEKARTNGGLDRQQTERPPRKYFRCGYVDHIITKCPKPAKDNKTHKKISVSTKGVIV